MTTELTGWSLPEEEHKPEPSPEEAALIFRISVFVAMRWIAAAGVFTATLLATRVFHISFPSLPVYIICAGMVLYNLVLFFQA